MLYNIYQFVHESLGLCFWDIPAIAVSVIMVIVGLVHHRNQKKREDDYEKEREEKLEALRAEGVK